MMTRAQKRSSVKRPDERLMMLVAIGLGLGAGVLLAAPLNAMLSANGAATNPQQVNPFSAWTGLGDKEVVILGTDAGGGNTDVIYTLRVENGVTHLTQIPRDTYIESQRHGALKANALYAVGGPETVKSELGRRLHRPIQHHILVNLAVIRRLGDALGGLEVDVPKRMLYHDNTQNLHIDLQPGRQVLRGKNIEGFLRFRHDELGDIGRLDRQRLLLKAMFHQITQPESLVRLPALLSAAGKDLKTDLGPMEIGGLITSMGGTKLDAQRLGGRPFMRDGLSYWEADWPEAGSTSTNPSTPAPSTANRPERYRFVF
jgi:polyisoprenyl-teichoic acid--peptidoglycan teichoic acid transferase